MVFALSASVTMTVASLERAKHLVALNGRRSSMAAE